MTEQQRIEQTKRLREAERLRHAAASRGSYGPRFLVAAVIGTLVIGSFVVHAPAAKKSIKD